MREPYPRKTEDTEDRDRRQREEGGTRIGLESAADEDDEELDDDEEADETQPNADGRGDGR
ncbi:MAG: hypothetical protein E6H84_06305 [Chloroflexi bacterium]|nr:MAG: hypothetical protein E6H84_06305 [Chloroflexota bacterium]